MNNLISILLIVIVPEKLKLKIFKQEKSGLENVKEKYLKIYKSI
jgi:hypothetical protein